MCDKLNLPILGVVENMSWFVDSAGVKHELFGAGGGQKVADFAKAPLLAQIPIDPAVREWGDRGMPVVQARPDSEVAQAFADAAEQSRPRRRPACTSSAPAATRRRPERADPAQDRPLSEPVSTLLDGAGVATRRRQRDVAGRPSDRPSRRSLRWSRRGNEAAPTRCRRTAI